jgi:hypothetical protein
VSDTPPAPVFVVGAGRSGTTLLRLMLNAHPQIAIPSESHFLVPLLRAFPPGTDLAGADLERAVEVVASSAEWRRDFAHSETELRAAVGPGPIDVARFVDRVFRLEVGPEPARWGDKTPAYLEWVDTLLELFPAAHVVAIVRDPRDVYLSLLPLDWFGRTTWELGRYIARNGRFVERSRRRHPPERFHVVRYEDLVLQTDATLRDVCAFLGVPFVEAMADFHERAEENVRPWELEQRLHTKLLRPPTRADVGRWRREGPRREHEEIERTVDDRSLGRLRARARVRHYLRSPGELARRAGLRLRRRGSATSGTPGGPASPSG